MADIINGTDLYVFLNDDLVAYSLSYSINIEAEGREITNKGTGVFRTYKAGLLDVSAACDGLYVYGSGASQIYDAMILRQPVKLEFGEKAEGTRVLDTTTEFYTGNFIITSFEHIAGDAENATYAAKFKHSSAFNKGVITPEWEIPVAGVYYVKNGGSDAADGLTDTTAWETLTKVNATSFNPGNKIRFRRGDTWRGYILAPSNGSAGSNIVFEAYYTGAKPKILGSKDISLTTDWTNHAGNVWKTTATAGAVSAYVGGSRDIGNLIFNNEASCGVKVSALVNVDTQGDFFFNTADNLIYIYSVGNPGTFYTHIECGGNYAESVVKAGNNRAYVTFRYLDIRYSGNPGIFVDRANNITIEHNDISWIGGWWAYSNVRQGNGIQMWLEDSKTHDIIVRYNKIHQCYDAGISPQGSNAHVATNILMYYNIITNCHYSYETWLDAIHTQINVHFINNTCINAGHSFSVSQRPDNGNDSHVIIWSTGGTATNCTIKNNIFYHARDLGLLIGFTSPLKFDMDYNLFYDIPTFGENNDVYDLFADLAEWQLDSGGDANSLYDNPDFIGTTDYHLSAGSAATDVGVYVGLTTDYDGQAVSNPPEIGAYEY